MTIIRFTHMCLLAGLLAVPTQQIAAQSQLTNALAPVEPVDALAAFEQAFKQADEVVDYSNAEGPQSWYRQHISTIQQSTPIVGCSVGSNLAAGAGASWFKRGAACIAGGVGFSSISPLINPIKDAVSGSPELDTLFGNLPKREASSAISLLSGSLDAEGRSSRQQSLAQETKIRTADIVALKERQQRNSNIWGQILLGAAQGYLAYEVAKSKSDSIVSAPAVSGNRSDNNSITILRRDSNGRSQGQYEAPLAGGGASATDSEDGGENATSCISAERIYRENDSYQGSYLMNKCSYTVEVSWGNEPNPATHNYTTIVHGNSRYNVLWDIAERGVYFVACKGRNSIKSIMESGRRIALRCSAPF